MNGNEIYVLASRRMLLKVRDGFEVSDRDDQPHKDTVASIKEATSSSVFCANNSGQEVPAGSRIKKTVYSHQQEHQPAYICFPMTLTILKPKDSPSPSRLLPKLPSIS